MAAEFQDGLSLPGPPVRLAELLASVQLLLRGRLDGGVAGWRELTVAYCRSVPTIQQLAQVLAGSDRMPPDHLPADLTVLGTLEGLLASIPRHPNPNPETLIWPAWPDGTSAGVLNMHTSTATHLYIICIYDTFDGANNVSMHRIIKIVADSSPFTIRTRYMSHHYFNHDQGLSQLLPLL